MSAPEILGDLRSDLELTRGERERQPLFECVGQTTIAPRTLLGRVGLRGLSPKCQGELHAEGLVPGQSAPRGRVLAAVGGPMNASDGGVQVGEAVLGPHALRQWIDERGQAVQQHPHAASDRPRRKAAVAG